MAALISKQGECQIRAHRHTLDDAASGPATAALHDLTGNPLAPVPTGPAGRPAMKLAVDNL